MGDAIFRIDFTGFGCPFHGNVQLFGVRHIGPDSQCIPAVLFNFDKRDSKGAQTETS